MKKKIIALILIAALVLNIVLFAAGIISNLIFWAVIIGIALIVYFGFRKKQ